MRDSFIIIRANEPKLPVRRRATWSIFAVLVLTTAIAIGIAGFAHSGIEGVLGTFTLSAIALYGVYLVSNSSRRFNRLVLGPTLVAYAVLGWIFSQNQTGELWQRELKALATFFTSMAFCRSMLVLSFVLIFFHFVSKRNWPIQVTMKPGNSPTIIGIPQSRHQTFKEFVQGTLQSDHPVRIYARQDRHGRLTMKFIGINDPGDRQRIRNFFHSII